MSLSLSLFASQQFDWLYQGGASSSLWRPHDRSIPWINFQYCIHLRFVVSRLIFCVLAANTATTTQQEILLLIRSPLTLRHHLQAHTSNSVVMAATEQIVVPTCMGHVSIIQVERLLNYNWIFMTFGTGDKIYFSAQNIVFLIVNHLDIFMPFVTLHLLHSVAHTRSRTLAHQKQPLLVSFRRFVVRRPCVAHGGYGNRWESATIIFLFFVLSCAAAKHSPTWLRVCSDWISGRWIVATIIILSGGMSQRIQKFISWI